MNKLLVLVLFASILAFCKSGSAVVKNESTRESKNTVKHLLDVATANLGVRYKPGGTTKSGFDCSGLVFTTFLTENITMPRSSYEQAKIGKIIQFDDAKKGDLIFFKTNKSKRINHVGLITEKTGSEIKFIHSSTSKGVIISSTKEPYYQNSIVQINRIIE